MSEAPRTLDADAVGRAARAVLVGRGLSDAHAGEVADTLVSTSLDGIDTHGIKLLPVYVRELDGGRANPRPRFEVAANAPALAVLDADDALGVVAGHEGMRIAVANARRCGVGVAVVRNSNHFGAAGAYARVAAAHGMIGLAFTNADALVAPHGSAGGPGARLFGTNPLAMSAPGLGDDGFHLDMATSQVSYTRVREHRRTGAPIGVGWAQDADGVDASAGGEPEALLPLGGYKGQGLAMMVQILCSGLAGMPADALLSHLYDPPFDAPRKVAHCLVCIDVGASADPNGFRARTSCLLDAVRSAAPAGRVKAPGDPERDARAVRIAEGIPVDDAVFALLAPHLPGEPRP